MPGTHSLQMPTLAQLADVARMSGDILLKYFRKDIDAKEKPAGQGLVTQADLESELAVRKWVEEHFPSHSVLGEEHGRTGGSEEVLWIVDPLDGTNNFAKGNAYFNVSIGVGHLRSDGSFQCQLACILQPTTSDLYLAERGKGATCNGQRIFVRRTTELSRAMLCTGFSCCAGQELEMVIETIRRSQSICLGTRLNGAAALDMALTARGVFDGFFERKLSPWDVAAGSLLLEESGAAVTNFEGQPFDPLRDANVIAAWPELRLRIQNQIVRTTPSH